MKKLIKFLLFVGAVAGAAWALRDQLMPPPHKPTVNPPAFRTPVAGAPARSVATEGVDDLSRINGIGPVRVGLLAEHGITSFRRLAGEDAVELADRIGVSVSQTEDWISQAAELA